jgi:glycosyltransferase involved in cell wall biosynthesis
MKKKSIVYVNFSQYDNTGRILDYLKEEFTYVLQFSFDHLRLKNGRKSNFMVLYKNNRVLRRKKLFSLRTPPFLLFPSLPIVALLMVSQTIYYSIQFSKHSGKIEYFFSVNAFSAWIGLILKMFRVVNKSIFWVWDYFPLSYPDWRLKLARYIYWQFDKPCMLWSDKIVFTNRKLYLLRKKTGHLKKSYKPIIIPIGSALRKIQIKKKKNVVGFLGMLKENQGVDLWITHFADIVKAFPNVRFEVIGSGPEEYRYKNAVKGYSKQIRFLGFIEDQNRIFSIIQNWACGLATYFPNDSNESYWGDPSKIKTYMSAGVPILTTNVSYMAEIITKKKAGIVIPYTRDGLISGLREVMKKNVSYSKASYNLAKEYDYKKVYKKFFT